MKASEIQQIILADTGLKTSVKTYKTGSMKGYVRIMPTYQNGSYPSLPVEVVNKLRELLKGFSTVTSPLMVSFSEVNVFGIDSESVKMKRESKPKEISEMKVKEWGSKNSQMRLDKATARNAKKLKKGNCARYW